MFHIHTYVNKIAHLGKNVIRHKLIVLRLDPRCRHSRENKHGREFIFVSDSEWESRKERGFVLGVAVWLWGSIGLTSRGLGLWSRKRHRQEVRAGQNSLEMLYHHYQQGTVSHQGHKKLRGLRGYVSVCIRLLCRDIYVWMHELCVTNRTLSSRMLCLHANVVWFNLTSGKVLRKTLCYCFCSALPSPNRFR